MAAKAAEKPGRVWLRRILYGSIALAVLYFTVEGGEYGTSDVYRQAKAKAALDAEVSGLRVDVEALRRELESVRTDDRRLERMAREEYGMVRGEKEILYWIADRKGLTEGGVALPSKD